MGLLIFGSRSLCGRLGLVRLVSPRVLQPMRPVAFMCVLPETILTFRLPHSKAPQLNIAGKGGASVGAAAHSSSSLALCLHGVHSAPSHVSSPPEFREWRQISLRVRDGVFWRIWMHFLSSAESERLAKRTVPELISFSTPPWLLHKTLFFFFSPLSHANYLKYPDSPINQSGSHRKRSGLGLSFRCGNTVSFN